MLILVFYFPAIGKIKGACNTSSLPTAVAPILAEAAPPALSHQLDWGNKKSSIKLRESKGDPPAQERGKHTAETSLSSFWQAQILVLTKQWEELKATLSYTSHLWATDITLMANGQLEHRLCQPHLDYRGHIETPMAAPGHFISCTLKSIRKGLGSWRTWPVAFMWSQQGSLIWRNIMN